MMRIAEIVKTTNNIHTHLQGLSLMHQGSGTARQTVETLAKSGIEAFDKSSVDDPLSMGFADQAANHLFTALPTNPTS
jgi:hypothetical protein